LRDLIGGCAGSLGVLLSLHRVLGALRGSFLPGISSTKGNHLHAQLLDKWVKNEIKETSK
jgi:hypothetical protein